MIEVLTRSKERSSEPQKPIAFARVFSGTLKLGQSIFIMGAKHGINGQIDINEEEVIIE